MSLLETEFVRMRFELLRRDRSGHGHETDYGDQNHQPSHGGSFHQGGPHTRIGSRYAECSAAASWVALL